MRLSIRSTIYAGVMVGLLACSHCLVIAAGEQSRAALIGRIQARQRDLAELRRSTPCAGDTKVKMAELQQVVARFESGLPQSTELDEIIKDVRQMAESNSLQTRAIQALRGAPMANSACKRIELSVSGDFNGFYAFLLQLERLPWLTQVTEMQLERSLDHDGEMQAKLTLSVFFLNGTRDLDGFRSSLGGTQNLAADSPLNPPNMQVPLPALHSNPFRQGTADARAPAAGPLRQDKERAAMLTALESLRLQSVIRNGDHFSCMINSTLYVEGEQVGRFTIEQINAQSVVVRNGMYRFELRTEN